MYWFNRTPYVRYVGAAVLVFIALALEVRPVGTVRHPFVLVDLPAGSTLDSEDFEMRDVPAGLLPPVAADGMLAGSIRAGEALLPSHIAEVEVPPGWWVITVELPAALPLGSEVRLATPDTSLPVPGVVTGISLADTFGRPVGLVAVPESWASLLVSAERESDLVVMVAPPSVQPATK